MTEDRHAHMSSILGCSHLRSKEYYKKIEIQVLTQNFDHASDLALHVGLFTNDDVQGLIVDHIR